MSYQQQPSHVSDVIYRLGGHSCVAQAVGLHHATVHYWREIPLRYVALLCKLHGVRPSVIRPDLAELFALERDPATYRKTNTWKRHSNPQASKTETEVYIGPSGMLDPSNKHSDSASH